MIDHTNDPIVDRLLAERPALEPVDLDRIKLQVLGRGSSYKFDSHGAKRKALAPVLAVGFMTAGTAGVMAGGGGTSQPPAACHQYKSKGKPKTGKSCKPPKPPSHQKPPKSGKSNKPPSHH